METPCTISFFNGVRERSTWIRGLTFLAAFERLSIGLEVSMLKLFSDDSIWG